MNLDSNRTDAPPADDAGTGLRFSVIVPVLNRAGTLRDLLAAMARQDYPRTGFELVICDDGSTEDIAAVVKVAADELGLRLTYLRQPRGGAGRARNLGLAHASGEIVAFTDSDCLPESSWLTALDRAFRSPDVIIGGGSISYRNADHLSGRCINFLNATSLGGAGGADPSAMVHMDYNPRGMNLAVRREAALAAGGFPAHAAEDIVFVHRVRSLMPAGSAVPFFPDAPVLHNESRSLAQAFRVSIRRGRARARLLRPLGLHQPVHALPASLVAYLIAWTILAVTGSTATVPAAMPLALYASVLGVLAIQGAVDLRDWRALAAIPVYALAIHLGHGVGYLSGCLSLHRATTKSTLSTLIESTGRG